MSISISIIIPVYNMEQYLPRCLDSIIGQGYKDLEIILINDGSTDSSPLICDKYARKDDRIQVIHQRNAGVSAARNAGLDKATGTYVSFIDPDDWINQGMYETLAKYVNAADVDILRFNAYRKGVLINELPFKEQYSGIAFEKEILLPLIGSPAFGGMFILGVLWLHFYRRDIIEKHHIRFNTKLRRCEDRLFTLTVALHSDNIRIVSEAFYNYEVYEESLSNKYDSLRWQQELIYLEELKKEYTKCKPDADFIKDADNRILSEYLLRTVTSINNEFFSNNENSFVKKYENTKEIINNPKVRLAVKTVPKENINFKEALTLGMIEHKLPLSLSLFNTLIVFKNKVMKNG